MSRYPDSNRGPTHYECVALPTEPYRQHFIRSNAMQRYCFFFDTPNFALSFLQIKKQEKQVFQKNKTFDIDKHFISSEYILRCIVLVIKNTKREQNVSFDMLTCSTKNIFTCKEHKSITIQTI